ncbi:uncharacterized protein B0T15DRAFT_513810 [Chaetomium strumarium]|uniref:Uncharacterized protein n=1 Tax=Chaetomium strumarium TaxID=1170767 RepID=A0AAJ0LZP7_9PEZI|nr:hypothetical protein B0T15DRAFT_513810 [Chaetomium strumarium]
MCAALLRPSPSLRLLFSCTPFISLALRLWLGWLGAAHTPRNSRFALYLAPVAFENNKMRNEWYDVSGKQSKLFGHMDGFVGYAAERFTSGKEPVLGLLTPVLPTLQEAKQIVRSGGRSALDSFNSHPKLRRFGVAVLLCLVVRNGVEGLQVASFSPWDKHDWIKESWKVQKWDLLKWKEALTHRVAAWAAEHNVTVHAGYSGGSIKARKDRDQDSVEMAAGWLHSVVTRMEKTVPGRRGRP